MKSRAILFSLLLAPFSLLTGQTVVRLNSSSIIQSDALTATNSNNVITGINANASGTFNWARVSKTGSSLADLTTRSASDLTSGVISNDRLPSHLTLANLKITDYASSTTLVGSLNLAVWGDSLVAADFTARLAAETGYVVYSGGVGGETSTQIKTRMLAASAKHPYTTIIWAGRNNYADPGAVKTDIAAMVAALGHDRYMVISVLNGDYASEYVGQANHAVIVQLNADLATTYGAHYLDVRSHLVSLYNSGIPQDVIDHGRDIPPSSLRADNIHLTTAGYQAAADFINANLAALQGEIGEVLSPSNLVAAFASPGSIGLLAPAPGRFTTLAIDESANIGGALGVGGSVTAAAATGNTFFISNRISNSVLGGLKLQTNGTDDFLVGSRETTDSDFHIYSYGFNGNAFNIARSSGDATYTKKFSFTDATDVSGSTASVALAGGLYAAKKITSASDITGKSVTAAAATGNTFFISNRISNSVLGGLKLQTNGTDDFLVGSRETTDSDFHIYSYGFNGNAFTIARSSGDATYTKKFSFTDATDVSGSTASVALAGGLYAAKKITSASSIVSISPSAGMGYATGAGAAQVQGTSRTTGVTINAVSGAITLFSAAGSTSWQTFTVTNSAVAATDVVIVNQKTGTDLYEIEVTAVGAGSFNISFRTTGGTTTEQPVFNFAIIKGVSS